jgi:hypothetical protein
MMGVTNLSSNGVIIISTIRSVRNQLAKTPLKSDIGNWPLKTKLNAAVWCLFWSG